MSDPDEALRRARQRLVNAEAATGGGRFGNEELTALQLWGKAAVAELHAARQALAAAEAAAIEMGLQCALSGAAASKPGRRSLEAEDMLACEEIERMVLADPDLTPTEACWSLYHAGKLASDGGTAENVVDRVMRRYNKYIREKYRS